jgi:hypothetical protein
MSKKSCWILLVIMFALSVAMFNIPLSITHIAFAWMVPLMVVLLGCLYTDNEG